MQLPAVGIWDRFLRFADAGEIRAIVRRVQAQRDAGADHVCIQVVADDLAGARRAWRQLAPALL
jgi:2-methylisocitrate lyase-like PEP mutase family enzyme